MLLINTGSRRWPTLPRLVLATVLVLGASGALPARAQEQRGQVQPRQRDRERKAMSAFAAGRYQDALNLYADLYADYHDPVYLRNIGRCQLSRRL